MRTRPVLQVSRLARLVRSASSRSRRAWWMSYRDCTLLRADLRKLRELPCTADLLVVDAAHDFDNAYADLKLALSADPKYLFVDDAADRNQAAPAIEKFLRDDVAQRVLYTVPIDYVGGGLVIKLRRS